MAEIWKDIAGYEGLYQVSNLGNVKSLDKVVNSVNVYGEYSMLRKGKTLKQSINKDGYCVVKLQHNSSKKTLFVHRLVAEAFIEKNLFNYVNHIDEDKTNNCVDNLQWVSHKDNCNHATRNKRISKANCKPVIAINLATGESKVYNSLKDTVKDGFNSNMVSSVINGYKKTHKNHIFKLVEGGN